MLKNIIRKEYADVNIFLANCLGDLLRSQTWFGDLKEPKLNTDSTDGTDIRIKRMDQKCTGSILSGLGSEAVFILSLPSGIKQFDFVPLRKDEGFDVLRG
jgi:hypothetical protein